MRVGGHHPEVIKASRAASAGPLTFYQVFFHGVDWAPIHRYTAPFRPELHSPVTPGIFDESTIYQSG
jgi:hypothetical protein